jgi:pectin methylesterase-like acyl-CoA thioesterase
MRALIAALVLLVPAAALSVPVGGHRWPTTVVGPGRLATSIATVAEDCDDPPHVPCYETHQAAIDALEASDATGSRLIIGWPKAGGAVYAENVSCDLSTGSTTLLGMGSGDGRPRIQGTTAGPAAITARRCVGTYRLR